MKRIKGLYMATVIINFDFSPYLLNFKIKDFDEIRTKFFEPTTPALKEMIEAKVGDLGTVEINQQSVDLHEVEVE